MSLFLCEGYIQKHILKHFTFFFSLCRPMLKLIYGYSFGFILIFLFLFAATSILFILLFFRSIFLFY